MMYTVEQLKQKFTEIFGESGMPEVSGQELSGEEMTGKEMFGAYFAPGRVNLIGEHTDYNGGHVFPCALTMGTYAVIRRRKDRKLRFYSLNFKEDGLIESSLDDLEYAKEKGWTNYPRGIIWTLLKKGYDISTGIDVMYYGDIPNGAGLSSSASLEVVTGLMISDLFGLSIPLPEIALIGQYAENNYNGMNCGIMDQFASAMGKKNCAIFLDTDTLEYEYAPMQLSGYKIVLSNSNVKHSLVDSAYNDRRRECEEALIDLQKVTEIRALCELTGSRFESLKDAIKDPVCKKRAKHAVYENERTVLAVQALQNNDLEEFGKLMNASHVSLRDDYETSCKETDLLAKLAWNHPGVAGSRITGGGFGGCTVSIVREEAVESFIREIGEAYQKATGIVPEFYVAECGEGAHVLD